MTTGPDARLFDLGYRTYEGGRERPARAILTLAIFTLRRVLGLGRGARHKVLPAITLAIAFLPALVSVGFSVLAEDIAVGDLISYGDYTFIISAVPISDPTRRSSSASACSPISEPPLSRDGRRSMPRIDEPAHGDTTPG